MTLVPSTGREKMLFKNLWITFLPSFCTSTCDKNIKHLKADNWWRFIYYCLHGQSHKTWNKQYPRKLNREMRLENEDEAPADVSNFFYQLIIGWDGFQVKWTHIPFPFNQLNHRLMHITCCSHLVRFVVNQMIHSLFEM